VSVVTLGTDFGGRVELVRRVVTGYRCHWCGEHARFEYGIVVLDRPGTIRWQGDAFCGVGCMRAYTE
jgi:hypothetical protein